MDEADIGPQVNELANLGPVVEIPRTTVDAMNEDTGSLVFPEQIQHLFEHGPTSAGSALRFGEPAADAEILDGRVLLDGQPLF